MQKRRRRLPIALPIIIVVFFILGYLAWSYIPSYYSPEQLGKNVLLNAIPFVLIFVAILLTYISIIILVGSYLNNNISARVYKTIETILIAGIVFGVIGMFQPWIFKAYTYGFIILLFSVLGFILWSHVIPKSAKYQEELTTVSVSGSDSNVIESGKGV